MLIIILKMQVGLAGAWLVDNNGGWIAPDIMRKGDGIAFIVNELGNFTGNFKSSSLFTACQQQERSEDRKTGNI